MQNKIENMVANACGRFNLPMLNVVTKEDKHFTMSMYRSEDTIFYNPLVSEDVFERTCEILAYHYRALSMSGKNFKRGEHIKANENAINKMKKYLSYFA